jgi:hypothetical protein
VLPVRGHGIGVCLRLSIVVTGARSFGHQRSNAQIVGIVGQVSELIVDDDQFVAQGAQTRTGLAQSTLDQPLTHRVGV